jgi:hypothetical protein
MPVADPERTHQPLPEILRRPWAKRAEPARSGPTIALDPGGAYGEAIAYCTGFHGDAQIEAAATAMAAIPELIAALRAAHVEAVYHVNCDLTDLGQHDGRNDERIAIRDLIASALGKAGAL